GAQGSAMLDQVLSASAIGGPERVRAQMAAFIEKTGADELMIASAMFDHEARKKSLTLAAKAMRGL
ncbi:MAG: alkane 1-monooxygenase, partial [Sphingomonadales bacterium]